ncbi:toll-like receptor 13 [Hyperolius riggenbachi]|uniref:toll-like receptor 13 n=1 Tax=Hyperolius riggenbachi TaxID=752182 RepID=UPI0035A3898B
MKSFNIRYNFSSKEIIILITMTLHIAPPVSAFGYAKCILMFRNAGYADCIGQRVVNLTESVLHLPNKTLWLNVSRNDITVVEHRVFAHFPKLLELQLSRNKIGTIHSEAFYNLSKLYLLDLSYNLIQSLQNVDMKDLTNLRILHLSHNKLKTIESVNFDHLKDLQELDLSFNQMTDIRTVGEAVRNLNQLSSLNMSYNSLADLQCNQKLVVLPSLNILDLNNNSISRLDLSYVYLPNLTVLSVMRNNMSSINGSTFTNVPNLLDITFNENPLTISALLGIAVPNLTGLHWSSMRPALQSDLSIACQVLQSFPKLQQLDIKHSKIKGSNLHIIGNCTNLTSLILSTSPLNFLERTELQAFKFLETLYLDKCKIQNINNKTWLGLDSLRTLILQRNRLSALPNFLFSPLRNLRYLDVSKNHLTHINSEAFSSLTKLTHLLINSCKITVLAKSSFFHLWNLRYLDVQDNSISLVKPRSFYKQNRLETLLLSGNKIQSIKTNWAIGLKVLKTLSLDNNNIYRFTNKTFIGLKSLISLNISRNHWSFNKQVSPKPFKNLAVLENLDISYQDRRFEDRVSETLFEGLRLLKKLNLRGIPASLFSNVSFSSLTNLTELDLTETFRGTDQDTIVNFIHKFFHLKFLTLDSNEITDLPENTFAHFTLLEYLSLKHNKLRNISQNLLKPLTNLSYFDAYMNPLSCSCENYWFQNWSELNTQVQVPFIQKYDCYGQEAHHMNFVSQDFSFCGTDISMFYFFGSFSLTLIFMVTSLLVTKLKWSIHYFYYMMRAWFQLKPRKENKIYIYDAYISYCSDDEEWVVNELLLHLEQNGEKKYKLCFKPRDFVPGVYHLDNIQDAINSSRKTLCVVSRDFLESQWCRMEVEMACSKVFYQREDVLLVVFLEEIPDYRLSAYHKLRKLIKQNTYINWPEDPRGSEFFWFKLRKALRAGVYEEDTMQLAMAI